jgi:hypothetical protein
MQEVPDGIQAAEVVLSEDDVQTGKGAMSASFLRSSDTSGVSRRTAFTCAILSGVSSAPDSRETVAAPGCGPADNGPAASNIASCTRVNGSNGSNGSNGNGSSTAEGNGFASQDGNQGSGHGANGVSSAAPPCVAGNGVQLGDDSVAAKCMAAVPQSAGR